MLIIIHFHLVSLVLSYQWMQHNRQTVHRADVLVEHAAGLCLLHPTPWPQTSKTRGKGCRLDDPLCVDTLWGVTHELEDYQNKGAFVKPKQNKEECFVHYVYSTLNSTLQCLKNVLCCALRWLHISNAPWLGENVGKQHLVLDLVTLQFSSFRHVPFQITLKSKTKRGKCIPGVFGIHVRNHKNNTSSGAPFRMVISNIWGNSNEKHCVREKPKRSVSSPAPSSFLPSSHEWLWCGQDDWKTKRRGSI